MIIYIYIHYTQQISKEGHSARRSSVQTKEGFNFHGMLRRIQHIDCIINLLPNVDSEPNPMLDKKKLQNLHQDRRRETLQSLHSYTFLSSMAFSSTIYQMKMIEHFQILNNEFYLHFTVDKKKHRHITQRIFNMLKTIILFICISCFEQGK